VFLSGTLIVYVSEVSLCCFLFFLLMRFVYVIREVYRDEWWWQRHRWRLDLILSSSFLVLVLLPCFYFFSLFGWCVLCFFLFLSLICRKKSITQAVFVILSKIHLYIDEGEKKEEEEEEEEEGDRVSKKKGIEKERKIDS